jgi:hypothetical protein
MSVLLNAALAWLVATLAVAESTRWPVAAIIPMTLIFGVLVGAVGRAVAGGSPGGKRGILGRSAVAVALGVVVGEIAAVVLFSGSIDRVLDEQAAGRAEARPAVAQASADLDHTRQARAALDATVEQARRHRDEALVVARCEFNPSSACPQTHVTGVPGTGPETRTANDFLADTQRELDNALTDRDGRAPTLDAQVAERDAALAQARHAASAGADRGIGARWVAMNDYTSANAGALALRLLAIGFFVLLSLLPLILRRWRGETTQDRGAAAHAERERAELEADTAIAVKRAQVRAAAETLWAEHQLESARLAVEAQNQIERAQQQRRVMEAIDGPVPALSQRTFEPTADDVYLPIAAEAEAASLAAVPLPQDEEDTDVETPENLPARADAARQLVPSIPDISRTAARWIRPFVPPIIASAIDTTTKPLRGGRRVLEETEEVHFTHKRTRKVTLYSEDGEEQ